jgi:hypothetical protein
MGAVTALNFCCLFSNFNSNIRVLACDSAFVHLGTVLKEIAAIKTNIPVFLVDSVLSFIKKKIQKILKKDIFELDLEKQLSVLKN